MREWRIRLRYIKCMIFGAGSWLTFTTCHKGVKCSALFNSGLVWNSISAYIIIQFSAIKPNISLSVRNKNNVVHPLSTFHVTICQLTYYLLSKSYYIYLFCIINHSSLVSNSSMQFHFHLIIWSCGSIGYFI